MTHVQGDLTRRELFRAPLDGRPSAAAITSGTSYSPEFALASGTQRVLTRTNAESSGTIELFSTRLPHVVRPSDPPR